MVNTGQMLLVLGALVLFSTLLPSLNESIIYNDRTLMATNAEITAISLAEKFLGEATTKVFDEVCVSSRPQSTSQLTAINSFGPESGETYPGFDDIDDFHGITFLDSTTLPSVLFNITGQVNYVDQNNPLNDVTSKTYLKRLRFSVTGPYLVDPSSGQPVTIYLEQIFAYY